MIIFCLLVGLWVPMYLHREDQPMYTASARLVLDNQDPKTRAEAAAISDIAQAIATSPTQVNQALVKAGAKGRNAVEVAKEDVSVRVLGSSGILELSVSDPSRTAAAAISNALAEGLIEARLEVTTGQVKKVDAALEGRIARLNRRISALDSRVDSLTLQAARADSAARRKRAELTRSRQFLSQQRAALESQRVSLVSTGAFNHTPSIISPAAQPRLADQSGQLPDLILGALLGLIAGVGLAGLLETFRTTQVDTDAVAREFDAPLLGLSGGLTDADHSDELARNAARIRLAAQQESNGAPHSGMGSGSVSLKDRGVGHRPEARSDPGVTDHNQLSARVVREAPNPESEPESTDTPVQANGRQRGLKGGRVRAEKLSPEERSEIVRKAAKARQAPKS
ncbi:MAG TPA: hypothetical protein VES79_08815 [Solirubrobacteraceae bacterium]|nr:hypothetical protein [Solirubrobacteraceae bacterium]